MALQLAPDTHGAKDGELALQVVAHVGLAAQESDGPRRDSPCVADSGLSRKANALAHNALFAAAIGKAKTITTEHVQVALRST